LNSICRLLRFCLRNARQVLELMLGSLDKAVGIAREHLPAKSDDKATRQRTEPTTSNAAWRAVLNRSMYQDSVKIHASLCLSHTSAAGGLSR